MRSPSTSAAEPRDLAAEYALGLLVGDPLERARALFAGDQNFRTDVGLWLGRLAPMLDEVEAIAPPDALWSSIEQRLTTATGGANVVQLKRRVSVWRGVAAASSAIAAALALVLLIRPEPQAPPVTPPSAQPQAPALIAVLGGEAEPAALLASWSPSSRSLTVAGPGAQSPEADRARELWVIPADGTPRSLGVLARQPSSRIAVPAALAEQLRQGATLAISVEPLGGSPTGLPTGAVVASGTLERA